MVDFFFKTTCQSPKVEHLLELVAVTSCSDRVPDILPLQNLSGRCRSDPSKLIAGQASKLWMHVEADGMMTSLGNLENALTCPN